MSELHSQSNKDRVKLVSRIHQRGGVCLTSYGIVVANEHVLTSSKDREIVWVTMKNIQMNIWTVETINDCSYASEQ